MANRRMFSKAVVCSDAFLDMPATSRALYFQLGMEADDDGFVGNPRTVIRISGCSHDDMNVLISKNFVKAFESGVIVITHWGIMNKIQPSRYHETIYQDEKKQLSCCQQVVDKLPTGYRQDSDIVPTQYSIGKDSIDKVSIVEVREEEVPPPTHINGYVSSYINLSPTALQELTSFIEDGLTDDVIRWAVDSAIDNNKRTWSYVKAILNRCVEKGLKTIAEVRAAEVERTASKQRQPTSDKGYQQHDYSKTDEQDWFVDPNELLKTMKG